MSARMQPSTASHICTLPGHVRPAADVTQRCSSNAQHAWSALTFTLSWVGICGSKPGSDASSHEDPVVASIIDLPKDAVVLIAVSALVMIHVLVLWARHMHLLSSTVGRNEQRLQERRTPRCVLAAVSQRKPSRIMLTANHVKALTVTLTLATLSLKPTLWLLKRTSATRAILPPLRQCRTISQCWLTAFHADIT